MYDDTGDCSVPDGGGSFDPSCKRGAHYCATPFPDAPTTSYLDIYLFDLTQEEGGMPPLPSRPLSERDKEIVRRWAAEPDPMTRLTITAFALLLAAAGAGCTVYPAEPAVADVHEGRAADPGGPLRALPRRRRHR